MATAIATIDDFHGVGEVELVDLPGLAARPAWSGTSSWPPPDMAFAEPTMFFSAQPGVRRQFAPVPHRGVQR